MVAKCTSSPCANTATGEDPGEIELREARKRDDEVRRSDDDSLRWSRFRLYSDSKRPEDLELLVHKQSGTHLRLDPGTGSMTVSGKEFAHRFSIAHPAGSEGNLCPNYSLQVLDASSAHVVVRKICLAHQYKPDRTYKEIAYYLYDRQAARMREIWRSSDMIDPKWIKVPKREPAVVQTNDGYTYQWKGKLTQKPGEPQYEISNVYMYDRSASGETELVCRDLTDETGELETGTCEGETLFEQARP
jgi:hypothetical protein